MKKKSDAGRGPKRFSPWLKRLLIMKMIAILLFVVGLTSSYAKSDAQTSKLNLKFKSGTVKDVIEEIERQADLSFMYDNNVFKVDRQISIDAENETVKSVVEKLIFGLDLKYELVNRYIVITSKNSLSAVQQQKSVSGKVTDSSGAPLPGVSVVVKGTTSGIITDNNGHYSLPSISENATLIFSFVGMKSQEVVVGTKTTLNVVLTEEAIGIEEIVAVGYGTQKKINLTGSLSSVNSKDLKSISTDNAVSGLSGKLPGLRIKQGSSEPGSFSAKFDIRGFGAPLIVVDGMVTTQENFVRINTDDIDQITILKDASAAIYGVKAANGVILVSLKNGISGKPKITYSGQYQVQHVTDTPKANDAYGFALLLTEREINGGKSPDATTYKKDDLQKFKDGTYPSTDWYGLVVRDYMPQKNHNISISGGNDKIKYFTSLGYLDEEGLWKSGDLNYKKYNIRSSVLGKITDNLEAEISINGMSDQKNEPGSPADGYGADGGIFFSLFMQNPTVPVYANNNPMYLSETFDSQHPLAITNSDISGYTKTKNKTFQGTFTLNYKVPYIKGLDAKFMYGYLNKEWFQKAWDQKFLLYKYNTPTDTYLNTSIKNNPSILRGEYTSYESTTIQGQLSYNKVFLQKHEIKASMVFEERHEKNDNLIARKEFAIEVDQFYAGNAVNTTATSNNIYENDNQSIIGRLNYGFLSKYLAEFGFNYGGSSKFPSGKRWGFFPYVSAGWRVSEEGFFKEKFSFITNLKIRGSWGQMGDDNASSFQFLTGYTYPSGNYVFNNALVSGLGFKGMPNENITWFTVTSKNIGMDLDVKNGLLNVQFDLFQRYRSGLLATRLLSMPSEVGVNLPQENLNEDMRRGVELVLGHSKRTGDFKYDINGNFTYTRGQATRIERADDLNSFLNWRNNNTDRWDDMFWGYKYVGQFQSQDEINNSPVVDGKGNTTIRPGDLKYEDVNKDGMISDLDRVPIGRGTMPEITFGLNGSFSYKQFDMNIFFQGSTNYNFLNQQQYLRSPQPWAGRNGLDYFVDRWHHEDIYDVSSPWVPGRFPSSAWPGSNGWDSSFWVENASYLRLKSLEIGYSLKKSLVSKINFEDVRFYVSGYNLFTLTKMSYFDPEREIGMSYPITKNYTVGVNITF